MCVLVGHFSQAAQSAIFSFHFFCYDKCLLTKGQKSWDCRYGFYVNVAYSSIGHINQAGQITKYCIMKPKFSLAYYFKKHTGKFLNLGLCALCVKAQKILGKYKMV